MLSAAPIVSLVALLASGQPDARPAVEQPAPPPPPPPATDAIPAAAAADPPPAPLVAATPADAQPELLLTPDDVLIDGRRRPGAQQTLPEKITQDNPGAVRAPPPEAFPTDQFPLPDRWRLVQTLCADAMYTNRANLCKSRFDPYHQNFLKGDIPIDRHKLPKWLPLPIKGDDWFLALSAISDTVVEPRSFPTPVGVQTTERPDSNDVFGRQHSLALVQTLLFGGSLIKGSTAYKPPEIEYRILFGLQANYVDVNERRVLDVRPSKASHRLDHYLGLQEAFVDYHLRNVSDRFDFDSVRVGIQPFQADFRGFLFNDNQLGIRFFGNRDNNRFQYNLAAFWRLDKDTNSGLNVWTKRPRDDAVFFANVFAQDFPIPGLTSQVSVTYNLNRERGEIAVDDNGFPVRPALLGTLRSREYDVTYFGYATDGRIGRMNLTSQLYYAYGQDRANFLTGKNAKISAYFAAAEASYDVDYLRFRISGMYASGDRKPYNNTEGGFDAIFENPIFAGADTSYWIRQVIPFAGGGRAVGLKGRNGLLASLRSSKEEGQSNFTNPGTVLAGVGVDADILPEFRLSTNANHLWFANTKVIQVLRNEGSIPKSIGWDLSTAAIYRPSFIQNIVFRLSGAVLLPSKGFKDLFTNKNRDGNYYSVLFNTIVSF